MVAVFSSLDHVTVLISLVWSQSQFFGSLETELSSTKHKAAENLSPAPACHTANKVVDSDDEHDGNETEPAEDEDAHDTDT